MALYAKVDCMLDSNPKIRKAGRCGREVFLFLLRRNRILDARGILSAGNIDPDYLADQLMMSPEEAVTGVTACCNASLLTITAENVAIIGWSDEWAREPKSNAERQADHRRKVKENKLLEIDDHNSVTNSNGANVTRNANNVRKEKKREEKNISTDAADFAACAAEKSAEPAEQSQEPKAGRGSRKSLKTSHPGLSLPFAQPDSTQEKTAATAQSDAPGEVSQNATVTAKWFDRFERQTGAKPTWGKEAGAQLKRLLGIHGAEELCRRIDNAFDAPPYPHTPPADFLSFVRGVDKYATRHGGAQVKPIQQQPRPYRLEPRVYGGDK